MAKMRPPLIPEQAVPVIAPDGLRRLLKACDGKGFDDLWVGAWATGRVLKLVADGQPAGAATRGGDGAGGTRRAGGRAR
jgi:hypothetical protein